jgi:hypothetical protein
MRRLVIALLVLIGLLVAVDFGSAALAESAVSREMRQQIGLVDDPDVRINGFPFLTQALAGQYSDVDVTARRLTIGQLREVQLRAQLHDVSAPISMLLGSGPKTVRVRQVEGTALVSANDLERLVPGVKRMRVEPVDTGGLEKLVDEGGADPSLADLNPSKAARVVGTITLLGKDVEIAVIAGLDLANGKAGLTPRDVRLSDGTPLPIPGPAQRALMQQFTVPIDTGSLPLKVTPTRFRARDGGLEISGTASGLVLGDTAAPTATG